MKLDALTPNCSGWALAQRVARPAGPSGASRSNPRRVRLSSQAASSPVLMRVTPGPMISPMISVSRG